MMKIHQMRRLLPATAFVFIATVCSAAAQFLAPPTDPYFKAKGSWGQAYYDQWGIRRVGFDASRNSAWRHVRADGEDVIVAVIDTGLDWNHQDIAWENIWKNSGEIADNEIDDDGNGYVDDIIGWDFFANSNHPWDHDGHGTFVTGLIAATWNNNAGIAGINPHVKIMVLKALNNFGHSRASYLSRALVYAVDNGARVITMSVGGAELSTIEQAALDYAFDQGALIVVAAGNEGTDVDTYGMAASDKVITVAATGFEDARTNFSNWGAAVDIAAPGLDILSLRARRTDTMRDIPDVEYDARAAYVGDDKRFYRASGTSFSAPIVAGTASLLFSNNPNLTNVEVRRMLINSAQDIGAAGIDQYSGYGLLDASAALTADKSYFIGARITGVNVVQGDQGPVVEVLGSATASNFEKARLEIGAGDNPERWIAVGEINAPVESGALALIGAENFRGAPVWMIRLIVEHANGAAREARFQLSLG